MPLAVITSQWLTKENDSYLCLWPYFRTDKLRKIAVEQHKTCDAKICCRCPVSIKYFTGSYEKAFRQYKKFELEAEVSQTKKESFRRIRKRPAILDDFHQVNSFSSDDDLPTPRKVSKRFIKRPKAISHSPHFWRFGSGSEYSMESLSSTISQSLTSPQQQSSDVATCSNPCFPNGAVLKKIEKSLEFFKAEISSLRTELRTGESVDNLPTITVKQTDQELQRFNSQLENIEEMKAAILCLKGLGGNDIGDITRRILSKFIRNDLAKEYNWTGKNGKRSFSALRNISALVIAAVRKNKGHEERTETEVENEIKRWFNNAGDRDGGRSKRKHKLPN